MLHSPPRPWASCMTSAIGLTVLAAGSAGAAPITVQQTYQFFDNVSVNALGVPSGQRQQFGSTCVVLVGLPCGPQNLASAQGTTVTGTQGGITHPLSFVASALGSNHWARSFVPADVPDGAWSITATNGSDTATATTPSLSNVAPMERALGTAIRQSGTSPTFSWVLPNLVNGASVDAVTVQVRDVLDVRNGISTIIYRKPLAAGATTFSVIPGEAAFLLGTSLTAGRQYALEVLLQDTRNNSANGAFPNVLSQSRAFLHFSIDNTSSALQYLPMLDLSSGSPVFKFEGVPVLAGQTVFIDPEVAVGYDYQVGANDPNFSSVTLPDGIGDDLFTLWMWDGAQWLSSGVELRGGQEFVFGPANGVDRFRITGIEAQIGLDPYAAGSFTTGVSFVADGSFNGTMTPLVMTAVPEPATYALWLFGLASLWGLRRRHTN